MKKISGILILGILLLFPTYTDATYPDIATLLVPVKSVSESAIMLLLGAGLMGLAGFGRKKFCKKRS